MSRKNPAPEITPDRYEAAPAPELDPHTLHDRLMRESSGRHGEWPGGLKAALQACMGEMPPLVEPEPTWAEPQWRNPGASGANHKGFYRREVTFAVEPGQRSVGWLLTPDLSPTPRPTVICLQGHSSGAHISLGEARYARDPAAIAGGRDFGVQAVARGYNAFVLEQRAFGLRVDSRPAEQRSHYDYDVPFSDERCRHQAMVALLLGRTLLGERVHDVQRSIDLLGQRREVDHDRIACMGNSGGGTVSFYAACVDERISAVIPSCSFCPYRESIGSVDHCSDNYLPGALKYFDMPDLSELIAPRPMIVVAGRDDPLFPYDAVARGFETARRIYRAVGAEERVALHTGAGGHRFYPEAWESFERISGWTRS